LQIKDGRRPKRPSTVTCILRVIIVLAARRAEALEKVLLPEVEVALKQIDEQLDMMKREETIRIRWSHKVMISKER